MRRTVVITVIVVLSVVAESHAQTWINLTPGAGAMPAARRNASAILDPVENRMVIFAGTPSGTASVLNDVWGFDLDTNSWVNLTPPAGPPAPAPRLFPASIYDPFGHQMIMWSGQAQGVFFNDVWAFDLATNSWSQFMPSGGPPNVRYGVGYTFDPIARDLVTFAGFTNLGRFADVWRFNDQAATWTQVPVMAGPGERCLHTACYDALRHRMIMYAGQNNAGALDDLWALDLDTDTWTLFTPAVKPSGRFFATMIYDAAHHRAVVFGGQTTLSLVNQVWMFDLWTSKWTQVTPVGTPPSARAGAASVYDRANDRMIVFGGTDGSARNDVWALTGLSNVVTNTPPAANLLTLHANYPNPFNPSTTIRFELGAASRATLRVYDVRGTIVRTLFDETREAGPGVAMWDGRDDSGRAVGSGVYLFRLTAGGESRSSKMVLLK
ncbi:MAG TPA: kelch repeat-containing protein [Candidatus Krumholzibacteria bacterium]|nr:kelch repeat-containing protein [Candidatus Krumholzibacteria bacterium]